jgi:hypothetical protein
LLSSLKFEKRKSNTKLTSSLAVFAGEARISANSLQVCGGDWKLSQPNLFTPKITETSEVKENEEEVNEPAS